MMGHQNLSPQLNALLDAANELGASLRLQEVKSGQVVEITLGDGAKESSISVRIKKPAGNGFGEDAAVGVILSAKLNSDVADSFRSVNLRIPPVDEECAFVGACTRNPGAPLGMTMFQLHTITKGRHLCWVTRPDKEDEAGWLFPETVSNWTIRGAKKRTKRKAR